MRFDAVWSVKREGVRVAIVTVFPPLVAAALILASRPPYSAFLLLGILALAFLAVKPAWYVLAFWAFSILGPSLFQGISQVEVSLAGLVINPFGLLNGLLPLYYAATWVLRSQRPAGVPMRRLLLALAGWATASLFICGFAPQGIRQWVTLLNWISAYLLFVEEGRGRLQTEATSIYMALVALASVGGVFWSFLKGQGIPDYSFQQAFGDVVIYRATGFGTEAEGAGELLALFAIVCLAFAVGPLRRKRLLGLFVVLVAGVWCTHARTAALGLFVASLLVLWKAERLNWGSGVMAVGGVLIAIVTNPRFDLSAALKGDFNPIIYANALWRVEAWNDLIRPLSARGYLHGMGIGTAWDTLASSPHNEYIAYLHDFGLVGLAILLALVVGSYRYGARGFSGGGSPLARTWGLACMGVIVCDAIFKLVGIPLSSPSSSYSVWLSVAMAFLSSQAANSDVRRDLSEEEGKTVAIWEEPPTRAPSPSAGSTQFHGQNSRPKAQGSCESGLETRSR